MSDRSRAEAAVAAEAAVVKQRRLVLIAEHDPGLRAGLRRRLEQAGHVVVGEATDGAQALDLLRSTRPDVLLLDMTMPGLDGTYVLRSLANTSLGRTPAVVANAVSDADATMAEQLGADAVLLKSASAHDLLAAVCEV